MEDHKKEKRKPIDAKRGEVGSALAEAKRNRENAALAEPEREQKGKPKGTHNLTESETVYL